MTFVVTDNCVLCKHTDCVEVCPAECFHEGPNFLVIDPEECIDCALCEPACPIGAIFSEDELPQEQKLYLDINRKFSRKWPSITIPHAAMEEHEKWDGVSNKLQYLQH